MFWYLTHERESAKKAQASNSASQSLTIFFFIFVLHGKVNVPILFISRTLYSSRVFLFFKVAKRFLVPHILQVFLVFLVAISLSVLHGRKHFLVLFSH
jgi:hypothetical protein